MRRLLFGFALIIGLLAGLRTLRSHRTPSRRSGSSHAPHPSYDDIALRAYFIGLDHEANGEKSDPFRDWVEAEHELFV